jgi:quercetin dioxygenase-like cupin family protein
MSSLIPDKTDRRSALRRVIGAGAASLALPLMPRLIGVDASSLISSAQAAGNPGVRKGQGELVYIAGKDAETRMIAEWYDPKGATGPYRIAGNKAAYDRAPKEGSVSHYEAKTFNFPSGSIRLLTWKKGEPVRHMITFETEIFVLKGSATVEPLLGFTHKPYKIVKGDAVFMPQGYITNLKTTEDTVLLTFLVSASKSDTKFSLVHAKDAPISKSMMWDDNGKIVTASKPEEMKKAPKVAIKQSVQRYAFDGNSIRVATLSKGGRTPTFTIPPRTDVVIYIPQGRFRRQEGNQMLELSAGDALREKIGNPGWWEPLEDNSVFIASDAPVNPGVLPSASL